MSSFHDALDQYLAICRALGSKHRYPASALRRFVAFAEREGAEYVTVDLALRWATASDGVKDATRARRLGIVRGFARFLHATDPRTQVPPHGLLPSGQRRPTPHIYSDEEVADLMAAADTLRSADKLRCWTFATLVGLLAATGLRPSEALALDEGDADLASGVLSVRESKFGKSRFVPIAPSTVHALRDYAARRDRVRPARPTAAILVTGRGERLRSDSARRTFATLCQRTGLRPASSDRRIGRGPRLMDLRHTFATRRLIEWLRSGEDIERRMPTLSTYLGHVRIEDTYWYVQAVPELLDLVTERCVAKGRAGVR
jgi:integrase